MNYFFLYILSGLIQNPVDTIPVFEKLISINAELIYADHFDNLYVINENVLSKYNSKGEIVCSYFPEESVEISDIDVQNPYKIIVCFEKQNKIIFLDNNLSSINNALLFETLELFGDILFTRASDGTYWIYDNLHNKLIKTDSKFNIVHKKNLNINIEIKNIKSNRDYVFLRTSNGKILFYNYKLNDFEDLLPLSISSSFFITGSILSYFNNQTLELINIINLSRKKIKLPESVNIIDAVIGSEKIFFFDNSDIYISSVKQLMKK